MAHVVSYQDRSHVEQTTVLSRHKKHIRRKDGVGGSYRAQMTWKIRYDGICPSTKHDGVYPSTNKTREEHNVGGSYLDRQHEVHLEQGFPRYCGNPGKRGCWGVTPWGTP